MQVAHVLVLGGGSCASPWPAVSLSEPVRATDDTRVPRDRERLQEWPA